MNRNDQVVRFDWAIKRILREKANFSILEGFLSSLLDEEIKIIRLLESEGNRDYEENKSNRVDLLTEDSKGRRIIIEVQNEAEDSYFHRILFGTSKIINEYLERGQDYDRITKVYSVNIVFFNLGEGSDYIYKGTTEFRGLHDGKLLELSERLKKKFEVSKVNEIFPEYYILKVNDFDKVAKTPLDQWMYYLRNNRLPEGADAPGLRQAAETLRIASLSHEERLAYEKYMDGMVSLEATMSTAWAGGHYQGLEEGLVKGREEGLIKGREEGLEEGLKMVARKMLVQNKSIQEIISLTGLSEEEIESLRKS